MPSADTLGGKLTNEEMGGAGIFIAYIPGFNSVKEQWNTKITIKYWA
jgi:hypothetical protein